MIIVAHQQPHHHYTRRGNHLYVTCAVPLLACLSGGTACLSTLDGRTLLLPLGPNCLQPDAEHVIRGEGMPLLHSPHTAPAPALGPVPARKAPSGLATHPTQQPQHRRAVRAVRYAAQQHQQSEQPLLVGSAAAEQMQASVPADVTGLGLSRGDLHVHFQVLV
ncbi:hypothetical protein HYH02_007784 [Chlamydomonas schloesseri]|uniref:Chaperone DnaJ C-terminal domain-containing protein n=1 Tax=Chlamydomonas schloesseri TaxID=2026947 RepID=A0A835WH66_9CHLO|nr:hypothetical protein HYH02_007784 [Chlamydomonas schloesseri]|eukprot:KAG2447463.1 hypothetical protein HYH02_007784 [Chlamydomonas schloesseri]